ncbi:MAG: hypothetical protein ACP5OK_09885, partial [Thermoprotei archaeon]
LDHVVIVGSVAKCLSDIVCCSEVGDLDIAIDEIMARANRILSASRHTRRIMLMDPLETKLLTRIFCFSFYS